MNPAPRTLKILIVDDDDVDREQVQRFLSRPGFDFQVTEARNAESARRLFDNGSFDCVLLDCHLPDVNEFDLAEQFTRNATPVVMISGYEDRAIVTEAKKRGIKGFLMKSAICPDGLQQAIFSAVGRPQRQGA